MDKVGITMNVHASHEHVLCMMATEIEFVGHLYCHLQALLG